MEKRLVVIKSIALIIMSKIQNLERRGCSNIGERLRTLYTDMFT